MDAEMLQAEVQRVQAEAQQMIAKHQEMKEALVVFTAQINSKLGELGGYRKLLASMEDEDAEGRP